MEVLLLLSMIYQNWFLHKEGLHGLTLLEDWRMKLKIHLLQLNFLLKG